MTTIITRLMPDQAAADSAADRLQFKGVPARACDVIVAGDNADAKMARAQVHPSAMDAYAKGLAAGNAVLVVRTTYKPLGAARLTREVLAERETVNVGGKVDEDFFVPNTPDPAPSVLKDHPRFLTLHIPGPRGPVSEELGVPLLKARKAKRSLKTHGRPMSRMFWPGKLLSTKPRKSRVISGGRQMSAMFWPGKLLSTKPRRSKVIPGGGFPFSRKLGWKTVT